MVMLLAAGGVVTSQLFQEAPFRIGESFGQLYRDGDALVASSHRIAELGNAFVAERHDRARLGTRRQFDFLCAVDSFNLDRVTKVCSHMNGEFHLILNNGTSIKMSRSYKEKVKHFF